MINTGDMVVNPSTGERLIFRQTSADTGGRLVEVEAIITPDGACAGAHVHPNQEERFQVIEGLVEGLGGVLRLAAVALQALPRFEAAALSGFSLFFGVSFRWGQAVLLNAM